MEGRLVDAETGSAQSERQFSQAFASRRRALFNLVAPAHPEENCMTGAAS